MAVDVVHLVSPTQAFCQKSKCTQEVSTETAYPKMTSSADSGSSTCQRTSSSEKSSTTGSQVDLSLLERSEIAVEQLKTSRKQLEDEIEVELTVDLVVFE